MSFWAFPNRPILDRLLVNANVYTLDAEQPRVSAVAISRERIVAVGDDTLRDLAAPQTWIDDLKGATLIPGLTDAHIHWQYTALGLTEIELFGVPSKEEALRRVNDRVQQTKSSGWLVGRGWAQSMWPGGAYPTATDLDAITPNSPVMLKARSGHAIWGNSAALHAGGIMDSTPNPAGGVIQSDAAGHATGILFEDAIDLVANLIPQPSAHELAALMEQMQTLAWRAGLTG